MLPRRTTLGPLDNNQIHSNYSHQIPQKGRPSLIGRPSIGGSGMSLSQPPPMAHQQSMTSGRPSLGPPMRKSNVNGLAGDINGLSLQESRMSIGGRASMNPPRRSSAYNGRQSMAGGSQGQFLKDPRAIRDKQWQYAAIRSLVKFVIEAGYEYTITPKILSTPSIRDFQNLFVFLYSKLDPGYTWSKKFEDDVLTLSKCLRYPFAEQITKSTLQSVGSLHAWPVHLALLIWMVELIMVCESVETEVETGEDVGEDPDSIFHKFLMTAYEQYMTGKTDYESLENEMQNIFRGNQMNLAQDIERLQAEVNALEEEYKELTSQPSPLIQLEQKKSEVSDDIAKVKKWIETLTVKKLQLQEQLDTFQVELNDALAESEKVSAEKQELQQIVDAQEISPADVDRMNAERDQLTKNLEQLNEKNEDLTKINWDLEIEAQKKLDIVEKYAHEYNTKAYRLDLIPASAPNANGLNFELSINSHATKADQMLSIDLRGPIKHSIMNLRSKFKNDALQAEDSRVAYREEFDKVMEAINEKMDDLAQIETKVARFQEQYENEKTAGNAEFEAISSEIETLDKEIRRVKVERSRGIFDCQKEVREYEIEYDNLLRRYNELKERLAKQGSAVYIEVKKFMKQLTGPLHDLKLALERDNQSLQQEFETTMAPNMLDLPTHETCIADTSFCGESVDVLSEMEM